MNLKEQYNKETGNNCHQYIQRYAGANLERNGFSDEYVQWLEDKITSKATDAAKDNRKEYSLKDIIQIQTNYPQEKKNKLSRAIQSLGDKHNPPHTIVELMGFEPVEGKQDTYVKVIYK